METAFHLLFSIAVTPFIFSSSASVIIHDIFVYLHLVAHHEECGGLGLNALALEVIGVKSYFLTSVVFQI